MGTGLPTRFRLSRLLAALTAALMLGIAVLVGLSVVGAFENELLGAPVRWEPLRVWALAWCGASALYGLLIGALSREITRLAPGSVVPAGRATVVAALPVVNVMLLPGLFDESARFCGERLGDPLLEQRLRYLARGPAAIAIGGLMGLMLLGILLPGMFAQEAATAVLAGLSFVWLLLPPLARAWHLAVLDRALDDVIARESAGRARAWGVAPAAA